MAVRDANVTTVLFKDARLLDCFSEECPEGMYVWFENDLISEVSEKPINAITDDLTIDVADQAPMPGLIDTYIYFYFSDVNSRKTDSTGEGGQADTPVMRRARSGFTINVSSAARLPAAPYATVYGDSKATVLQLTESVTQHYAEQKLNVRGNSAHPGIIRTSLWNRQTKEIAQRRGASVGQVVPAYKTVVSIGDFALTDGVAAAAPFLAWEEVRQITGTMLISGCGMVKFA